MILHNLPSLELLEQEAASQVLASGWVAQGPEVEIFENELCRFFNLPDGHTVAVSSGSAALYLVLWALEGVNKRVGVPVYCCSALRNTVGLVGGRSVYLGCGKNSPNVDTYVASLSDIVPIERRELLDAPAHYPEALTLANTTVSLPAYTSLREDDVARIARIAKEAL